MKRKVKEIIKEILQAGPGFSMSTKPLAIGGGEWSLELYIDNSYVCEWVGSNGTWPGEEADDLQALANDAIAQAEAIIECMESRWPEKMGLIRAHSRLIAAEVPEIYASERISAFADAGGVYLVVVDGKPTNFKSFLGSSSKEEIRQLVRQCVKKGVFPSHTFIPRRYYANRG